MSKRKQHTDDLVSLAKRVHVQSDSDIQRLKANPLHVCTSCDAVDTIESEDYRSWQCRTCEATIPEHITHTSSNEVLSQRKCGECKQPGKPPSTFQQVFATRWRCNQCSTIDTRERTADDVAALHTYEFGRELTEREIESRKLESGDDKAENRDMRISISKASKSGELQNHTQMNSRVHKLIQQTASHEDKLKKSIEVEVTPQLTHLISHFNGAEQIAHRGMMLPVSIKQDCIDTIHRYHMEQGLQRRSTSNDFVDAVFVYVLQRQGYPIHYKEMSKISKNVSSKSINDKLKRLNKWSKEPNTVDNLMKHVRVWINMCRSSRWLQDGISGNYRIHPQLDEHEMKFVYEHEDMLRSQMEDKSDKNGEKLSKKEPHVLAAAILSKACKHKRAGKLVTDNQMALIVGTVATTVASTVMLLKE